MQNRDNMLTIQKTAKEHINVRDTYYTKDSNIKIKPFLKWAGGKSQMLSEIEKYYPFENCRFNKYAEPFVGGGAVLFDILSKYNLKEVYIGDINTELINTYNVIKNDIDSMLYILYIMQDEFINMDTNKRKAYYINKRKRFNELKVNCNKNINIEKAALMIYLNKTCFNGLYRVNKNGEFNVPMGDYENPTICDEKNLRAVSDKLKNVTIVCGDYRESANFIDKYTFVYFDPPYRPLTATSSFTAYAKNKFDDKAQIDLALYVNSLHIKGARIVVSNSDPKNVNIDDTFFDDIYSSYFIRRVNAARMINSNAQSRGKIKELLISNF